MQHPVSIERHGTPTCSEALMELDGIPYGRPDGSVSPWRFATPAGVELRVAPARLVLGSAEAQVEAVKAGIGIAQLATWLVADELAAGVLVHVLPAQATEGLPLHLVWSRRRQLTPKVNQLLALLTSKLRID